MTNTVPLTGSQATIPNNAISVVSEDPSLVIKSTIFVRRNDYNGMTVADYADTVIAGVNPPLDKAQFKAMFGASAADLADVASWISSYGITVTGTYRSSAAVELTGTVRQFNTAFDIELKEVTTEKYCYRTYDGWLNVPDTLEIVIEHIDGLDQTAAASISPMPVAASPTPTPGATPLITPQAVATAYNFPGQNNGNDGTGQVVAIILPFGLNTGSGGNGCGYTTQNLYSTFVDTYGLSVPTVVPVTLNGTTNNPTGPISGECMLDIACVGGIVPKATIVVYFCSSLVTALTAILNDTTSTGYFPKIITMSATYIEAPIGASSTQAQVDALLAQCATQGITFCNSSGDFGPNNTPIGFPSSAAGPGVCYPASSPYVLAVGGTTLITNPDGTWASEVAWNNLADYYVTGGAISKRFAVPSWQNGLSYNTNPDNVTVTLTTGSLSATQGRTTPDVALNADPYCGISFYYTNSSGVDTFRDNGGGTSASSPLWAGLIARQNQISGSTQGVVNAGYYANPGNFRDIISGNNVNYGTPSVSAFNATVGWDATTGLGSFKGVAPTPSFISVGAGISFGPGITFS